MVAVKRTVRRRTRGIERRTIAIFLVAVVIVSSFALYYNLSLNTRKAQLGSLDSAEIYAKSNRSVVTIQGIELQADAYSGPDKSSVIVLGSGFTVQYSGSYYLVTNFHVIDSLVNITVTFWNGDAFRGKVVGVDAYSDLGLVTAQAPSEEFYPLEFTPSSSLRVGEAVVAIGNPYAFSGTITSGIVSQIGRSISYDTGSGSTQYPIADAIQFSAPINPGNSGGPLLNGAGKVVGMTTAAIGDAEGLGFAIPSDTIIREFPSLVATGKYDKHPYLGILVTDMNYDLSRAVGTNVTYGVLIEKTVNGGPADRSGLRSGTKKTNINGQSYTVGGDVIVSINGTRIVNYDSLATYLERNALPGQTIQVGIVRSGTFTTVNVVLAPRQPPT